MPAAKPQNKTPVLSLSRADRDFDATAAPEGRAQSQQLAASRPFPRRVTWEQMHAHVMRRNTYLIYVLAQGLQVGPALVCPTLALAPLVPFHRTDFDLHPLYLLVEMISMYMCEVGGFLRY